MKYVHSDCLLYISSLIKKYNIICHHYNNLWEDIKSANTITWEIENEREFAVWQRMMDDKNKWSNRLSEAWPQPFLLAGIQAFHTLYSPGEIMPKYMEPCFFHIYKVFWSFLYDFDLLNPNPLSARRESLSNFVQTQKPKMAAKSQNPFK